MSSRAVPKICLAIVENDIQAVKQIEPLIDLFEVRIDLVGEGWQGLVKQLRKPWIACNRSPEEGGKGDKIETIRIGKLLKAIELGAAIVDIEMMADNLANVVPLIKKRAKCLISFHDFHMTPTIEILRDLVARQMRTGADICKVVTTATKSDDNLTVLRLVSEFSTKKIVSFAMGELGMASRILCPLVGGEFTYAAIGRGKESAPGQIAIGELRNLYEMICR
jgi:3-dehydroquinate dehydratase type I